MDRINAFVDSFIPENLPKTRKTELKNELLCHIYDKADYYRELGYMENDSISKAIEDFGQDEGTKGFLYNEFERLYKERDIYGIFSGLFVLMLNYLCVPLDLWVFSFDFGTDPYPAGIAASFGMVFAVYLLIAVARVKKFRKMLICLGIAITAHIPLVILFYPQMAAFSVADNIMYLIDMLTPFCIGDMVIYAETMIAVLPVLYLMQVIPAVYCFVSAVRIKRDTAPAVKKPLKKITVFCCAYICVAAASLILFTVSSDYLENYSTWFDKYYFYINEDSEAMYSQINTGDNEENAYSLLRENGFVTIEEYSSTLDRIKRKQLRNNLAEFDFPEGYSVWFQPEGKYWKGGGIVAIRGENGKITGKAVGNINEEMYYEDYNFGYSDIRDKDTDMNVLTEFFGSLSKGDGEKEIMSRIGNDLGYIYAKKCCYEDNIIKSSYRVYFYGITNPDKNNYYDQRSSIYMELSFSDGQLSGGVIHQKKYQDSYGYSLLSQYVK